MSADFVVRRSSFVVWSFVVRRSSFVIVRRSSFVIVRHRSSFVVRRSVVRRSLLCSWVVATSLSASFASSPFVVVLYLVVVGRGCNAVMTFRSMAVMRTLTTY